MGDTRIVNWRTNKKFEVDGVLYIHGNSETVELSPGIDLPEPNYTLECYSNGN